jgi:hypothetical protein
MGQIRLRNTQKQQGQSRPPKEGAYIEFPTSRTYPWPGSDAVVSLADAFAAIVLGNAEILARYFRQPERPDTIIIHALADLLDPCSSNCLTRKDLFDAGLKRKDGLVDLWDVMGARKKLIFKHPKKGQPKSRMLNDSWIGRSIDAALGDGQKLESVVAQLIQETGLSRATLYRAWESYNEKKKAFEDAWDSLDKSVQEELDPFLKSLPRRY